MPVNTTFYRHLNFFETLFVGAAGFEPATSCSQSRRDNRATLRPEKTSRESKDFIIKLHFYFNAPTVCLQKMLLSY